MSDNLTDQAQIDRLFADINSGKKVDLPPTATTNAPTPSGWGFENPAPAVEEVTPAPKPVKRSRKTLYVGLSSFAAGALAVSLCFYAAVFLKQAEVQTQIDESPPQPEAQVITGTISRVMAKLDTFSRYSVDELKLNGFEKEDEEIVPIITAVISPNTNADTVLCFRDENTAEELVKSELKKGKRMSNVLLDMPVFSPIDQKRLYSYNIFVLSPDPRHVDKQFTYFPVDSQTSPIVQSMVKQGWHIERIQGATAQRPAGYKSYLSCMTAIEYSRAN